MKKKIYLDLDGVLCDFEGRFAKLYGRDALNERERKQWSENWANFIERKEFEKLDWFPGGQELLKFIRQQDVDVEILSSSGGVKFHDEVERQKKVWLKKHSIAYKANIVPGRRRKKEYANANTILIDDTDDVVEEFRQVGGQAILHRNVDDTKAKLKRLLEK